MKRFKDVINGIIRRPRRGANGLSGLRRLAWEESFFFAPLDTEYPLGLWGPQRIIRGASSRPEKKERSG